MGPAPQSTPSLATGEARCHPHCQFIYISTITGGDFLLTKTHASFMHQILVKKLIHIDTHMNENWSFFPSDAANKFCMPPNFYLVIEFAFIHFFLFCRSPYKYINLFFSFFVSNSFIHLFIINIIIIYYLLCCFFVCANCLQFTNFASLPAMPSFLRFPHSPHFLSFPPFLHFRSLCNTPFAAVTWTCARFGHACSFEEGGGCVVYNYTILRLSTPS